MSCNFGSDNSLSYIFQIMDPETARKIRDDRKPEHDDTCSMCGKFCAVRSMNKALSGEYIDIL